MNGGLLATSDTEPSGIAATTSRVSPTSYRTVTRSPS